MILRDGETMGDGKIDDVTDDEIISLMVGRDVNDLFPSVEHEPGDPWVDIENLSGAPSPLNVSFSLRRGEIFGVAGLVGAGRTELLRTIFGLDYLAAGTVSVDGKEIRQSIRARMRVGFGFLSEDRKNEGLAQDLSLIENITLSKLDDYTRLGFIHLGQRNQSALELMKQVHVKAHSGRSLFRNCPVATSKKSRSPASCIKSQISC